MKPKKLRLKKGDVVIALRSYEAKATIVGKKGRCLSTTGQNYNNIVSIEFEEDIGGHSAGIGRSRHCWNIPAFDSYLKKVVVNYNE